MAAVMIYGLADPRTSELKYIGRTARQLAQRLNEHICSAKKRYHRNWLEDLKKSGLRPDIFEIEKHETHEEGLIAEIFWIAYFKSLGCQLTNLAKGGKGSYGYRYTQEQKYKTSEILKGNQYTKGRKRGKEECEKISSSMKKKFQDPIFKAKHLAAQKHGEENGNSKLTWGKVREIRQRHANGEQRKDILKDYPVRKSMFYYIVNNKHWRE